MPNRVLAVLPGLLLAIAVAAVAWTMARIELGLTGFAWMDALVLAILVGAAFRTARGAMPRAEPGIHFSAKTLLEVAIVLLGASVALDTVIESGGAVIVAAFLIVPLALAGGYAIGRLLGLSPRLATLVACGNAICGNSAILAVAPVVDARASEVASSVAFTAALGVVVVLALPLAAAAFGLGDWQYGMLAGLTVYAVPQVLAATAPVSIMSAQIGMIVKLARVLMLGPVILALGIGHRRATGGRLSLAHAVPWFILGFFAMVAARVLGLLPEAALPAIGEASTVLTLVSMAALGLSVDMRTLAASGGRVLAAGALSALMLAAISGAVLLVAGPMLMGV